ncbi:MAG: glycosyltransferase family 9 protein [Elusimicrobia bacterium]|nr:glycosyltransferase family 9 protein [Elusimicrobiota bacterium]
MLGYAAIGDAVFFLPVLAGLRRMFPRSRVTFLANPSPVSLELIPASGLADDVELAQWEGVDERERRSVNAKLVEQGFDGILLSLSSPAHFFREALASASIRVGHCSRLVAPAALGAAARIGWLAKRALVTGEYSRRLLLDRKVWIEPGPENAVRRNLRLLEALGAGPAAGQPGPVLPIPEGARAFARIALADKPKHILVGVHLGFPENPYRKMWPAERFGAVCRRLRDEAGAEPFLVGGPEEARAVAAARAAAGWEIPSFAGRRRLVETFALIERCGAFLSNDTGLAKAAMALRVPTVTVWGPTDPAELGAWESAGHRDVRLGIGCSPCVRLGMPFARGGIDFRGCGHHRCLGSLGEEEVFRAALEAFRGR